MVIIEDAVSITISISQTSRQASGPIVADPGKSIRCHIPMCNLFPVYIPYVLQALSLFYFISTTPNKDQQVEQHFYILILSFYNPETTMSSAVAIQKEAFRKRRIKCLAIKVVENVLPQPIPMIQVPFCRPWIALQYILESDFSVEPFRSYMT